MLKATLREYLESVERSKEIINLDRTQGTITIGRSPECTYTIGKELGKWVAWLARIQATIEFTDDTIILIDGTREKPSSNGVWLHGKPIQGTVQLVPGLELTLFRIEQEAKVSLVVHDPDSLGDHSSDTYTPQDLVEQLYGQVQVLGQQSQKMQEQVVLLAEQLTKREAIDNSQEQRLLQTEKRINRMFTIVFGSIAAIVVIAGFLGGDSDNRKLLTNAAAVAVSGGISIYFEKQRKDLGSTSKTT